LRNFFQLEFSKKTQLKKIHKNFFKFFSGVFSKIQFFFMSCFSFWNKFSLCQNLSVVYKKSLILDKISENFLQKKFSIHKANILPSYTPQFSFLKTQHLKISFKPPLISSFGTINYYYPNSTILNKFQ